MTHFCRTGAKVMTFDPLDLYGRASEWTLSKVAGAADKLDASTQCDQWDGAGS
jgi:hypothetical protein